MDKFYNIVLLALSWLFLAAAVVILIFLLSLNNGDMSEMWPTLLGSAVSALFFAALAWVARKASIYISNRQSEAEDLE